MNKGIIVGRITQNLELRYTPNNMAVCEINIACNNTKDDTTFLKIDTFKTTAETVGKYCKKGDTIGIEYIVKNHNWTDKNGNKHYDYSFIGQRVYFIAQAKQKETNIEEKTEKYDNMKDFEDFGNQISIDDNFLD